MTAASTTASWLTKSTFYLCRSDPVAGNFHHIVSTSHEPHVAIFVFVTDISCGIDPRNGVPIEQIPVGFFVDRAHH